MQRNVVGFGKLTVDKIFEFTEFPKRGEITFYHKEDKYGGGGPFNVLMNIAGLNHNINMYVLAHCSSDELGTFVRQLLSSRKINMEYLIPSDYETPSTIVISETENSVRSFLLKDSPIDNFFKIEEFDKFLNEGPEDGIFYIGYLNFMSGMLEIDSKYGNLFGKLFSEVKNKGYKIIADCVSISHDKDISSIVESVIKYLDVLVLNEIEFGYLINKNFRDENELLLIKDLQENLLHYCKLKNSTLIVHFPEGALYSNIEGQIFEESFTPLDIKGTLGAGDAFCTGIIVGMIDELNWKQTLKVAHTIAYYNLQSVYAVGPPVDIKEIMEFLETHT